MGFSANSIDKSTDEKIEFIKNEEGIVYNKYCPNTHKDADYHYYKAEVDCLKYYCNLCRLYYCSKCSHEIANNPVCVECQYLIIENGPVMSEEDSCT